MWWEERKEFFGLADLDTARMSEIKCSNGRSTNRCLTDDVITVPTKMRLPVVRTWMKQRNLTASIRVGNCNTVRLVQVATRTGPGEILQLRMPTTRLRYHMLDMESGSLQ